MVTPIKLKSKERLVNEALEQGLYNKVMNSSRVCRICKLPDLPAPMTMEEVENRLPQPPPRYWITEHLCSWCLPLVRIVDPVSKATAQQALQECIQSVEQEMTTKPPFAS